VCARSENRVPAGKPSEDDERAAYIRRVEVTSFMKEAIRDHELGRFYKPGKLAEFLISLDGGFGAQACKVNLDFLTSTVG
jgi:hypothetical protein